MKALSLFSIFIITTQSLYWSSSAVAAQNSIEAQLNNKNSKFGLTSLMSTQSSLHSPGDVDNNVSTNFNFIPSYKISNKYTLSGITGLKITHTSPKETTLGDTKVRLSHQSLKLTSHINLIPMAGFFLPTNEVNRDDNSFRSAFTLEPLFLSQFYIFKEKIDTTYRPRFTKNFHKFDRTRFNKANVEHSFSQLFAGSYNITEKLYIDLDFTYVLSWTYQGTLLTRFSMGQALSYAYQKNIIFSLGHTNSGDALSPSGASLDISPFDENTSTLYGQLRWTL